MAAAAAAPAAGASAGGATTGAVAGATSTGAVSGIAASAGMDVTTQLINFGLNQWAASRQFKKQKKLIQNRYQWMVADLRAAGLNPMLAVASPPPLPGVPIGGFGMGNTGAGNVKAGIALSKLSPEKQLLAMELKNREANYALTQNSARKVGVEADNAVLTGKNIVVNNLRNIEGLAMDQNARINSDIVGKTDRTLMGRHLRRFKRVLDAFNIFQPMLPHTGSSTNFKR